MTAATTTTTTVDTRQRVLLALVRRLARGAGATLAASRARWSDFVDSGQLGPGAATQPSRPTGRWI
jgi:hypothetical protein